MAISSNVLILKNNNLGPCTGCENPSGLTDWVVILSLYFYFIKV